MDHDQTLTGTGLLLFTTISAVLVNLFPGINEMLSIITKIIPIISFILFVIINHSKIKEGWKTLFKKDATIND